MTFFLLRHGCNSFWKSRHMTVLSEKKHYSEKIVFGDQKTDGFLRFNRQRIVFDILLKNSC